MDTTTEPKTTEQQEWYTAKELSARSGLSKALILARIGKGTIKAEKRHGYIYLIEKAEADRMERDGEFRRLDGKRHDLVKKV